jgi:ABC-type antimicrobial peptide transport system permease subunit
MLTAYLKIAIRNARKHKGYTFINLLGLAISFACCILICLWMINEMSYDKHYADSDRIHEILAQEAGFSTPNALAPFLQKNVPEIHWAARMMSNQAALISSNSLDSYENIMPADPTAITIFSIPFTSGDPETALSEPNSVVITEAMASKFFPDRDAMGQALTIDHKKAYTVTGVVQNTPNNSSLQFDMLVPMDYIRQPFMDDGFDFDSWQFWGSRTFVKVHPGITASALADKIADLVKDRYQDREVILGAINIGDVYLQFSEAKKNIKVFLAIAVAILVTACINFINLSTARYKTRMKEVGIRKVVGAGRRSLILQFMGESLLLVFFGCALAIMIVEATLPFFTSLFQTKLSLDLLHNIPVIVSAIGIMLLTGLITCIYPSLVLSRFHPIQVLKDRLGSHDRLSLRRILVIFQFVVSVIIIIGSTVIYNQICHMKEWDVGYNKEQVVNIRLRGDSKSKFGALKRELLQNPDILSITGATGILPYWNLSTSANWEGLEPDKEEDIYINFADYDFTKTYGIELKEGRDFDKNVVTDRQNGCIINESLAQLMGQEVILGNRINIWDRERRVVGIMKDFNFLPLTNSIAPLAIVMTPEDESMLSKVHHMSILLSHGNLKSTIGAIEKVWNFIVPGHPFEYTFLDERFDAEYKSIDLLRNLIGSFGLLAIFIACLGLFGVASVSADQRTKEMGIRKVLGASIPRILGMISKEYIILVALSNLIAWPLAWYMMNRWLEEFAYHVDINIGTLSLIGAFTIVIAMLTVGYKAIQVAFSNPVDAIQHE